MFMKTMLFNRIFKSADFDILIRREIRTSITPQAQYGYIPSQQAKLIGNQKGNSFSTAAT